MPAGLPLTLPTAYTAATLRFGTGSLQFEQRKDEYNALRAFIASSPSLLSEQQIRAEKQSFERPIQIPVVKRIGINLVDGRICVLDGQEATTDMVVLTFSTKGFRVKVPQHMLKNNYIGAVQLLATLLYNGWHKWYEFMENNCLTYAEANKSTALTPVPGYFTQQQAGGTGPGLAYTSAKGANFYAAYRYALGRNFLSSGGNFMDIMSSNGLVTQILMGVNGANNAINQASLLGGATQYPTNYLVPGSGYTETHYVFTPGAVGIYSWLSPNAADAHVQVPQQDYWFSEMDPMFNYFPASVHYQQHCEEKTIGTSGAIEPVYYDIYEYTIDPAFMKSYSSVAGESPIVKFNLTDV